VASGDADHTTFLTPDEATPLRAIGRTLPARCGRSFSCPALDAVSFVGVLNDIEVIAIGGKIDRIPEA
jgi:hypothetical protein